MERLNITEARKRFMRLPEETARQQIIAVTRRNQEVMALMSWDLYEGKRLRIFPRVERFPSRRPEAGWVYEIQGPNHGDLPVPSRKDLRQEDPGIDSHEDRVS
ncbi:MAG: type II toxin-antitoxin system Phd/YefM family antitoxin [Deltaproteobacteria bacterium]|nr:type II toxin-antitoxin system Phd/YefM family antitoxin [Deltaproteobacteria bacterium]